MEPSKEAIAARITRLNRQILGKVNAATSKLKKTIDREALLDALTVLYDECNDDPVKKCDELVKAFVDKYRSTLAELRRARVCLSDFDILQTIGRGHFGEVHMVREKHTSDVYALKTIKKEQVRRREAGAPEDERDVLALARSPWIPHLQYAFQDSSTLYLVMELCCGGDLAGLLARRNHPLAERDAAFYVAEVAHALKTLHAMGFVHRDVKPHNVLLDRCGHVKLGDFGSVSRLSEGGSCAGTAVGTPDYVAPELLAAAACAARHTVCLQYCQARGLSPTATAISACDYWSLGVVAFELVTLKRPFSDGDEDTIAEILANIQKYERDPESGPPFPPGGPSASWRALVGGLLRVPPGRRYNYLDTLQHPALQHLHPHSIRDQAPPWVPCTRGAEDASHFAPPPRAPPPPDAAPFRARPPFAGQLPFLGYSYIAPEENEDTSAGFNASHDCTAIDLATFKSFEKLAASRGRELASLQSRLAAAEAAAAREAASREALNDNERALATARDDVARITAENKRLERQLETEKQERTSLEKRLQEMAGQVATRGLAAASAAAAEADRLRADKASVETRLREAQDEIARANQAAETARAQQRHYKDSIAKERAFRRQTLHGGEAEGREAAAKAALAEAKAATELRAKEQLQRKLATVEGENASLQADLDAARKELARTEERLGERSRAAEASAARAQELAARVAAEVQRNEDLAAQLQKQQSLTSASSTREAALEEQAARTEARLQERLAAADARAAHAALDEQRHRDKVQTLEQLVRQLEREVRAVESRACVSCEARACDDAAPPSDTESVADGASAAAVAQVALLKEQLEKAEQQLQTRTEEIVSLRQEARTANLARWRKEREYNELSVDAKSSAREVKRLEERLATVSEARKTAEQKAALLQTEITELRPRWEQASKDAVRLKEQMEKLQKVHETAQAEVDRSRNDIRKLKCELQYSERRRLHAEEQEELSSRERAALRDQLAHTSAKNHELEQNNKALQEACGLLEEQLTDLEKLADLHEIKSKDLDAEASRMRGELSAVRARLAAAEREALDGSAAAGAASRQEQAARDQAHHAACQMQLLRERLESREARVSELEARALALEGAVGAAEARVAGAAQRVRDLAEECAALRTRAHHYHAATLQLQASLQEAQEEASAVREASAAAAAWWRTRETKAEATLRQQAKLIDFLQAKVEEAGRKKCSLSNKLFGRSGRRAAASPPSRRTNRELREEVDRLRAKLAGGSIHSDSCPPTPKKPTLNGKKSLENGDASDDDKLQIVWSDGSRERVPARTSGGALVLSRASGELRARLLSPHAAADRVPQNESARAFTVKLESSPLGSSAAVVCSSAEQRARLVARLAPAPAPAPAAPGYRAAALATLPSRRAPRAALYLAADCYAIGCSDGLVGLRGPVHLERLDGAPLGGGAAALPLALAAGRALVGCGGALLHTPTAALASALRRAPVLQPALALAAVALPDGAPPALAAAAVGGAPGPAADGPAVAVACGRRVLCLRYDAAAAEFRAARSLTVGAPPQALLLTARALFVAGEKPLKVPLPGGALEAFAADDPTVAALRAARSPPRALLAVSASPLELLLCYAECGVFLDETGRRTRDEEPKWSQAVNAWEFVSPFLYLVGDDRVTVIHITEDSYRAPPCTCDTASVASTASECFMPEVYNLKMRQPVLLGAAPTGIIVGTRDDDGHGVVLVEGGAAFRSIGASVESLSTLSDHKGSSSDLGRSASDLAASPEREREREAAATAGMGATATATAGEPDAAGDESRESVEPHTGFLADIRKRARQLRLKNRKEVSPEDLIKEILTAEVGLKRNSKGRKSPALISDYDSESDSQESEPTGTDSTKKTVDVCAEMFARQVRFQ